MLSAVAFARTQIWTFFLASVLYGMNTVTFVGCIHYLIFTDGHLKPWRRVNLFMTTAALLTFALSSFDVAIILYFTIHYFIKWPVPSHPGDELLNHWWGLVQFSNFVVQTFIGDAVLIFRVWVVWSHRLSVIIAPIFLSLVRIGCGIAVTSLSRINDATALARDMEPLMLTFLVLTLVVDLLSSTLIAYRIWAVHHESNQFHIVDGEDPFIRAIHATAEAGIIYVLSLVVLLVTYLCDKLFLIPISRITLQLVGITFNLVFNHSTKRRDDNHEQIADRLPVSINMEVSVQREPADAVPPVQTRSQVNSRSEKGWVP